MTLNVPLLRLLAYSSFSLLIGLISPAISAEPDIFPLNNSLILTEAETAQASTPLNIEIEGNTVYSDEILLNLDGVADAQDLQEIAQIITSYYLSQGYITSTAQVSDGGTSIQVQERGIDGIWLQGFDQQGNPKISRLSNYVCRRINLGVNQPFNTLQLESQLRLLQLDPLIENIEGTLRSKQDHEMLLQNSKETNQAPCFPAQTTDNDEIIGEDTQGTVLVLTVTEGDRFSGALEIDNYSPPSIGSERWGGEFTANITNLGDEFSSFYYKTLDGYSSRTQLRYQLPVNPKNGTVSFRWYREFNQVIQEPFDELDIKGTADWYEIFYRQPLIRDSQKELAFSLGFTHRDGQTFTFAGPTPFGFGPDEDGTSRTSVLKIGQDYTRRDRRGQFAVRSLFNVGTGLLDATRNQIDDNGDSIPDGQFLSWYLQVQRLQVLNPNHLLIIQTDLQLSTDSLLPDQQFVIGGGQSVRGYRQNVRAGDNGFRFSVEDRWTLLRNPTDNDYIIQLAPFIDMGSVWNAGDNPNFIQDQRFIIGLGVGVIWQVIPGLNARVDYAPPLITLEDQGINAQDRGLYFSVRYQKRF